MQDELAMKQVEVLLEMHTKRLHTELKLLHEELSRVQEELRKEIREVRKQDPPVSPQGQFGYTPAPQQAPQQWGPPQQQWQQPPQQWGPPQQQWQQPAPQANKWAPPPEKPPVTVPIDRNNVAPSEVSIDKFFNFSGGRK